ncbi:MULTISPECIES: heavy metal translocating P-type ATPase [Mycobacteriaceae]|uniref:Heavy metal translocating P-type ATPase n=1 Tax=Mycolicibacterium parafortuitum TaxID=39692 RepID=A0ACC6MEP7_MYCPF|nr:MULTISPECIES: heavy metal translocating P-type ATPase [Mycobacteriaceae]MDZ5085086.1 heavy metal translocating P-type ATPase [Mycolicibacterium parafortuitum]GFM20956.1 cation transporter ATPase D ctpD [Mycobacterium sp. PO1]GFM22080.1 cation transporter ATPase D ctpD [Mycobacterium sp. PO2]
MAAAWAVSSVRWAALSVGLFVAGAAMQVLDGPQWLWWALYLTCYAAGGWAPAREGLLALRDKTLDVDLLMVLAAVGAAAIGQVFDGALLIIIFATSGALEDVATTRTQDSVNGLLELSPQEAVVLDESGTERTVAARQVQIGDVVVVRPGERVSADGVVVEGTSEVDQSTITGEPLPAVKTVGDETFAGTVNGSGALRIRATRDPSETVVARIVAMVAEASATKAKTQLFIETIEQRYSAVVVVATVALFAIPLAAGADLQSTLLRAMTFMIVASPCAVVLSTMPPMLSAIANAGRHGVLIKSALALERLAGTDLIALDKTGTLTTGAPEVTGVVTLAADMTEDAVLALAAAAESGSEHPLGRAVVAEARARGLRIASARGFQALPGRGVRADIDGGVVEVVSPGELRPDAVSRTEADGGTAVLVLHDGHPVGVLQIRDHLRAEAVEAVRAMTALTKASPVLLTGDNRTAAELLANRVGIADVRAELLPEQKVDVVDELRDRGHHVLVAGDGVNDAPAMAAAHTSVAMGRSGADLTLDTADAVTVRDDLATIATVVALARRARRVVVANLVIAAGIIVVLVTWDLVGHLPLPLGVAGHEGSTILVALNGLRLLSGRAWRRASR